MLKRIIVEYEPNNNPFSSEEEWIESLKVVLKQKEWKFFCCVYDKNELRQVVGTADVE